MPAMKLTPKRLFEALAMSAKPQAAGCQSGKHGGSQEGSSA
eukprot:CAMPEP_0115726890 /NCGR_PEP_ID=MMETSP0272-20121206/82132_1 /TAXON_ID=71861 /ORGANISM="Scrippsiella trochoidea, Strain CCMP3099" /LENGTH=40 /DNA_ID= /DNA_START= /DNA_END= /DNA_ORIENTATION=